MDYPRKLVVPVMRLSDQPQRTLDDAVEEFARETRFPFVFGGYTTAAGARITSLLGNRTLSLHELRVASGHGLGGRAICEARPRLTPDYSLSPHITHVYDDEVGAERIRMLFAMPVVLGGSVRAVLYGASRDGSSPGTAFMRAGAAVAGAFAQEIRIEDEVSRRLAERAVAPPAAIKGEDLPGPLREELRGGHAELRRITASVEDPALREQLLGLERRLARIGGGAPDEGGAGGGTGAMRLSPRELDVISQAALGRTNTQIGETLSLTESTVKSYLKSAMSKLEASTRYAAVAEARRAGLIP